MSHNGIALLVEPRCARRILDGKSRSFDADHKIGREVVYRIEDDIADAVRDHGLDVQPIEATHAKCVRAKAVAAHIEDGTRTFLWDAMRDAAHVSDSLAWAHIGTFIGNDPCFIFFGPAESEAVYRIADGKTLNVLLAETCQFEFYLTDEDASYLICFNHHDILSACGTARKWAETLAHDL